jgi:hypothetical protein
VAAATPAISPTAVEVAVLDNEVRGGCYAALHALADFVVAAWKLRSTALAGRETNGGNPMV